MVAVHSTAVHTLESITTPVPHHCMRSAQTLSLPRLAKLLPVAVLALCGTAAVAAPPPKHAPAIVTPPLSGNSFRAVLSRSYRETSSKDEGDGVTTFVASFPSSNSIMFGKRDGFRKLTFFTSSTSRFAEYSSRNLAMYISVRDCKAPVLFMEARIFSPVGWVFLNRVGVLADGELALDQSLTDLKAQREVCQAVLKKLSRSWSQTRKLPCYAMYRGPSQ